MSDLLTRIITGVVSGVLFLGGYFLHQHVFSVMLLTIFLIIIFLEWPLLCRRNKLLWLLVPIYPLFPIFSLFYLNHVYRAFHILFPLYPFFISWIADTGGYLIGSLWGKHKICPSISPKKSWEGLLGGFLGVLLFVTFVLAGNWRSVLPLSIVLTLAAFGGDLFESFLKRRAGLKDTGTLLPGHGGLLDRFDSVFFVGVVVFLIVM
ncbi:phosphatidate cytidylyltransferase [Candidatus Dependentiae bacterium]|nr:phosphatidate cytidylyltransferase [Candidatus Dependentiae bacterium]